MQALRVAVVGAGANIAAQHFEAIAALDRLELVAVCDVNEGRREQVVARTGARFYADVERMLREASADLVAVITPHPSHAELAEAALASGAHVLVEKPMAVTVSEADRMLRAASAAGRILAVSFQQRFAPMTERLSGWLRSGELGEVQRVAIHEPWLRTAAYFAAAPWRATWQGEGGGVLMNQAPHALDLLTNLLGLPSRVHGLTRTARHTTACEDTAHALLEWPGGAIGHFASSTSEPETGRRLEIVGDLSKVLVEGDLLRRWDYSPGLKEHISSSPEPFGRVAVSERPPERLSPGATHKQVYADLVEALDQGRPPRCGPEQGRQSLELANAIALSSWTQRPVELPLDRAAYDAALAERQA